MPLTSEFDRKLSPLAGQADRIVPEGSDPALPEAAVGASQERDAFNRVQRIPADPGPSGRTTRSLDASPDSAPAQPAFIA